MDELGIQRQNITRKKVGTEPNKHGRTTKPLLLKSIFDCPQNTSGKEVLGVTVRFVTTCFDSFCVNKKTKYKKTTKRKYKNTPSFNTLRTVRVI